MRKENSTNSNEPRSDTKSHDNKGVTQDSERADLISLFQLLVRQPPPDHDFRTCPICRRHGITQI